jgi:hypothetical protein
MSLACDVANAARSACKSAFRAAIFLLGVHDALRLPGLPLEVGPHGPVGDALKQAGRACGGDVGRLRPGQLVLNRRNAPPLALGQVAGLRRKRKILPDLQRRPFLRVALVLRPPRLAPPGLPRAFLALAHGIGAARSLVPRRKLDYSIHAPGKDGDERNYHCHMMTTTRRMTATGLGEKAREWDDSRAARDW